MIAYGSIKKQIQAMFDDDSAETAIDILRFTNQVYQSIAALRPWTPLILQETSQGTTLPSWLNRVVYVEDDTEQLYFNLKGFPERYFSQRLYNYFLNMSSTSILYSGNDMTATPNSATVTSTGSTFVSGTHVGQYIRIGEGGIYKISAVPTTTSLTLTEAFHYADWSSPSSPVALTSQHFEIRPQGTLQIAFTDENGDAITSSTIKMWYSRIPWLLYNDYDTILLPGNCEAVLLGVARKMNESSKYVNDSIKQLGDYEEALAQMRAMDPMPSKWVCPRDKNGCRIRFGRRRGGYTRVTSDGSVYL